MLSVTKTFDDDSVDAGTSGHTFTIDVTNDGTSDAEAINLTDASTPASNVTSVSDSARRGDLRGLPRPGRGLHLQPGRRGHPPITVTYSVAATVEPDTVSNTASPPVTATRPTAPTRST